MGSVDAEPAPRGTRRPIPAILAVTAVVIAVDQLTKWWALEALTDPRRTIDLVGSLRFRVIYNTGTAFSLTSDSGPVVSIIAVVVIGYLLVTGRRMRAPIALASYGMIMGGTIGNLLDRGLRSGGGDGLMRGPVIDFVDAQWFPVFNVADAALVVGIGLLVLVGFRSPDVLDG